MAGQQQTAPPTSTQLPIQWEMQIYGMGIQMTRVIRPERSRKAPRKPTR